MATTVCAAPYAWQMRHCLGGMVHRGGTDTHVPVCLALGWQGLPMAKGGTAALGGNYTLPRSCLARQVCSLPARAAKKCGHHILFSGGMVVGGGAAALGGSHTPPTNYWAKQPTTIVW